MTHPERTGPPRGLLIASWLALLIAQLLAAPPCLAQATTATLKGRVLDSDRSGLPGVVVSLRSARQPSGNKQVVTDVEGNFRIPLLPVARDYILRVDYPGFAPVEVGPIDLDAGKTVIQDVTLRTDVESTETIVVESSGSIVDVDSTKTSSSYNSEFIEGLPIIGHNYQDILTLAPGVTDTDGDGNPNVHGARDTGMQYRLDGGNITDVVSGTFGQNLNVDMIEELEVITSGASAEYGRADGGFANIITKSGGNDFEGKFSLFWQGRFLDGDGANNNDVTRFDDELPDFRDVRPTLSLGGAIVKDRLWYFGTFELLHTERPVNQVGASILITSRGNYSFAKLTWQVDSWNKLALQATADPRTFEGLGLALGVSPESDYLQKQGSVTPQLKWTSTISPQLLLESTLTSFKARFQLEPVSDDFHPTTINRLVVDGQAQAQYPCVVHNCNPARGETSIYQIDAFSGQINGPYFLDLDQHARRNAIKTDLSYTIEDAWGQHNIKGGLEFQDETFHDEPLTNPILFDYTEPFVPREQGGSSDSAVDRVNGYQVLQTFDPIITPQDASSFNSSAYLLDSWKPLPNLTVGAGLRLDREDIDSSGYVFFDPRDERRQSVGLWRAVCSSADALDGATDDYGLVTSQNCYQYNGNPAAFNGLPPDFSSPLPLDHPDHPITDPAVLALDLDNDGDLESAGEEGDALMGIFTNYFERQTTNFSIVNTNLAPRFSVSWDPWADGKTKVFGTWGRYFDRLFLGTVAQEIGPDRVNYAFFPDPTTHVLSRQSYSRAASTTSVTQTDRGLATPYTDELTIGFERELAPEWSGGITWIRRTGTDLLQDVDVNHLTCPQHEQIGVDPYIICGDAGRLETDRFGDVGGRLGNTSTGIAGGDFGFNAAGVGGAKLPNGAPDLYTMSPFFNQVLRVENANSYEYDAVELKVVRRLHRNWQMQASYTWSEAFGQAEFFLGGLGNDPETVDDEEGYLLYDQRHVVKFQMVTRLPKEISLGSVIQWASGTPWSLTREVSEYDSTGNIIIRTFFPTSQRNDQRNEGAWTVDGRVEKNFVIGKVQAAGFLSIQNLLDADNLAVLEYNLTARNGIGLAGTRDFGRRFELGATFRF